MPSARASIRIAAAPVHVRSVVTDFARYPEILPEMRVATVLRAAPGDWTVAFTLDLVRPVSYTLRLWQEEQGDGAVVVRWSLVEGNLFRANEGSWTLRPLPDGATEATYEVLVQLALFVPKPLMSGLAGTNLPKMLEAFKIRAER